MADFAVTDRSTGFEDTSLKKAPKRIIICCDGTWQSSVTNTTNIPSNITRIARYLSKVGRDDDGQDWQQLVFYDAGIGTGVGDVEAKFQGGTGSGFVGNVIEAYNFIVLNYNPGDKIFCFGFSRGAYTARAVAGLVTDIGIIRPRDMQDFPELYRRYQANTDSHVFRKSQAWRDWVEGERLFDPKTKGIPSAFKNLPSQWKSRPHYEAPESTRWVEAVGVFDTVGSLGIPKVEGLLERIAVGIIGSFLPVEKAGFHNVALSPYIKHAYHAMALDEHRRPFTPTLWHYPGDEIAAVPTPKGSVEEMRKKFEQLQDDDSASQKTLLDAWSDVVDAEMANELKGTRSKLIQVWFPGVHINAGGGSDDLLKEKISDFEQISMITLNWMVEQLKDKLNFSINFANMANEDRFMLMAPVVAELIDKKDKNHWLMKRINAIVDKTPNDDPWKDGNITRRKVLAADALKGWATGPIIDSYTGAMKKGGSEYRTPGEYKEAALGQTREFIHPTVQHRIEALGNEWDHTALKSFKRVSKKDDKGNIVWEWVKGNVRIPEWKIGGLDSLERTCVVSEGAKTFLAKLDKEYGLDTLPPAQPAGPQTGFQPQKSF